MTNYPDGFLEDLDLEKYISQEPTMVMENILENGPKTAEEDILFRCLRGVITRMENDDQLIDMLLDERENMIKEHEYYRPWTEKGSWTEIE